MFLKFIVVGNSRFPQGIPSLSMALIFKFFLGIT